MDLTFGNFYIKYYWALSQIIDKGQIAWEGTNFWDYFKAKRIRRCFSYWWACFLENSMLWFFFSIIYLVNNSRYKILKIVEIGIRVIPCSNTTWYICRRNSKDSKRKKSRMRKGTRQPIQLQNSSLHCEQRFWLKSKKLMKLKVLENNSKSS